MDLLNEVWKESRGCADWVVMVDIDEHLFVPQSPMQDLLERYKSQGITLIPALGFQIISEEFPEVDEHLVRSRTWGTPWHTMCKLSIFNPDAIEETNFPTGRHKAKPVGHLKLPRRDELLLFHYKYLGFERTFEKQNLQYANIGAHDVAMGGMAHYGWSRKELRDHWDNFLKDSRDLSWPDNNPARYPYYLRWWRPGIHYLISLWIGRGKKFFRNPIYMIKRLAPYFEYYKNCLVNMPKRLGMFIKKQKHYTPHEKFGDYIEEINRSPIRKEIYQLMMEGECNGKGGDTIVASNGNDGRGAVIHCLHSVDAYNLQDKGEIQKAIAAKEKMEEKHQKEFDAFVITNSLGFEKNAMKFAKKNKVTLVSQFDLIEFISQVKVS